MLLADIVTARVVVAVSSIGDVREYIPTTRLDDRDGIQSTGLAIPASSWQYEYHIWLVCRW